MLIEWSNLKCAFDGRTVFENFSGSLDVGERVRVAGPSGCGKTSFLSMLLGFLKPTTGTVSSADDIRALASYVPQEADFGMCGTADEWIRRVFSYRRNRGCGVTDADVAAWLERLRLPPAVRTTRVASLSGGEKQRIAIAVAALLPRRVIILDEPFSALDESTARVVADELKKLDRAILYTSHVDIAPGFATREVTL